MDKFSLMQAAVVDFKPMAHAFWEYAMQVMPLLVVGALTWAAKYFGVDRYVDNKLLHDMLDRAVSYGVARANTMEEGWEIKVDVANDVLADALKYAVTYSPELLAKYKLSPEDVVRLLMAKLPPVKGTLPDGTTEAVVAKAESTGASTVQVGPVVN